MGNKNEGTAHIQDGCTVSMRGQGRRLQEERLYSDGGKGE